MNNSINFTKNAIFNDAFIHLMKQRVIIIDILEKIRYFPFHLLDSILNIIPFLPNIKYLIFS